MAVTELLFSDSGLEFMVGGIQHPPPDDAPVVASNSHCMTVRVRVESLTNTVSSLHNSISAQTDLASETLRDQLHIHAKKAPTAAHFPKFGYKKPKIS